MRSPITRAALAAVLALSATTGCEHPDEPDESAELRAGVGGADREREGGERERATAVSPPRSGERALPPPPGPRTSTPGGMASGLHQSNDQSDLGSGGTTCPSTGETPASPLGSTACGETAISPPTSSPTG